MKKTAIVILAVFVFAGILVYVFRGSIIERIFEPTESQLDQGVSEPTEDISHVVENLDVPWEIAFLPSGDMLVTQRPGQLERIGENGQVYEIEGVEQTSEGGLLGVALHPEFEENSWVYLYMTTRDGDGLTNRVERYELQDDRLASRTAILSDIPGASTHDGGRLAFGPDAMLYVTTGDAGRPESSQDIQSLAGKILRVTENGEVPADNPFGNEVYSYGHRNAQGIAWDDEERLWSTEHGRSGTQSGFDELNLIVPGGNYGWPDIEGDETAEGMIAPVAHSGANETWAPAGMAYTDGSLYFAGLRGQSLYQATIKSESEVSLRAHFSEVYGRLRAVTFNDGYLHVSTSNTDGRGNVRAGDDRILRIDTDLLNE